jgi:hypothetical protein
MAAKVFHFSKRHGNYRELIRNKSMILITGNSIREKNTSSVVLPPWDWLSALCIRKTEGAFKKSVRIAKQVRT